MNTLNLTSRTATGIEYAIHDSHLFSMTSRQLLALFCELFNIPANDRTDAQNRYLSIQDSATQHYNNTFDIFADPENEQADRDATLFAFLRVALTPTPIHAQYLESTEICGNFMNAPVLRVTAMTAPTSRQLHASINQLINCLDTDTADLVKDRQKMLRGQMDYAVSTHNAAAFKLGKARLERLSRQLENHSIAMHALFVEINGQ